ncbi:fatty acyl-CoA reductase 1-like [Coccinella septempunctata]|uniref:fatty acyl-CoA reductase 1-like n=1 Tax=Coccinella septempunctata TaxID=41139 RepID=UPI001D08F938|nr:fatty acyl-CoA reductase 1-like [Coccinella septempunctata]
MEHPDRIAEFFEEKVVLITGATGFIGKVLLEKLLRACPRVKNVIVLVRPKKGKSPRRRMEEILSGPLFNSLRDKHGPEHLKKVKTINGDVLKKDLDISTEEKVWLYEEVQVVFHCAATVRFDECLRTAVLLNVRGTQQMLELAKGMRNLQVFQYISTAYCHMEEAELFEKVYDPPADPHKIIKICEWLRKEEIDLLAPRLLGNCPNAYAYTKALAEALVAEQMENLPVQILRPSVVVPIWKEPIPGWTDNLNGPSGLLLGAGKGVLRTIYLKGNACADYISVDLVANALLFFAFLTSLNVNKRVYHVTTNKEVRVTYDDLINRSKEIMLSKIPLPGAVWYPGGSTKRSKLYNKLCIFLYHTVPAILVDTLLYVIGYEPVLMRVQRRINRGFEVLGYYANNQWTFNNQQLTELRTLMNPTEKKIYKLDLEGFNFDEYLYNAVLSVRRYLLNEPDETIPASKRHMLILWALDRGCKIFLSYALMYLLYTQVFLRFFH